MIQPGTKLKVADVACPPAFGRRSLHSLRSPETQLLLQFRFSGIGGHLWSPNSLFANLEYVWRSAFGLPVFLHRGEFFSPDTPLHQLLLPY